MSKIERRLDSINRSQKSIRRSQATTANYTTASYWADRRREIKDNKRRGDRERRLKTAEAYMYALATNAPLPDSGPDPMTMPPAYKLPKDQRPQGIMAKIRYNQDRAWWRAHREDWVFWDRLVTDYRAGVLSREDAQQVVQGRLSSL